LHISAGSPGGALSPGKLATLAYRAEVLEFNEPGGMMDHFASALGGVLHIETRGEFRTHTLPPPATGTFVLCDSLEPKDTTGVLGRVKKNALAGFDYLREKIPEFDIETIDAGAAERALGADVSDEAWRAVLANISNRDITRIALRLFNGCGADGGELGMLLDSHHANLRDGIGISTPKIERLIDAAKSAGAAGCKINGSGGGGCMVAYTLEDPEQIVDAAQENGGKAYILKIDTGFKEESHR
jgi:galactokinase